jgi:hypothetical protein
LIFEDNPDPLSGRQAYSDEQSAQCDKCHPHGMNLCQLNHIAALQRSPTLNATTRVQSQIGSGAHPPPRHDAWIAFLMRHDRTFSAVTTLKIYAAMPAA